MSLLNALALIVWILVSIAALDGRWRIAVGIALILVLVLALLGVIHVPARS